MRLADLKKLITSFQYSSHKASREAEEVIADYLNYIVAQHTKPDDLESDTRPISPADARKISEVLAKMANDIPSEPKGSFSYIFGDKITHKGEVYAAIKAFLENISQEYGISNPWVSETELSFAHCNFMRVSWKLLLLEKERLAQVKILDMTNVSVENEPLFHNDEYFADFISMLAYCTQLESLNVSDNQLGHCDRSKLEALRKIIIAKNTLKQLYLCNNNIDDPSLTAIFFFVATDDLIDSAEITILRSNTLRDKNLTEADIEAVYIRGSFAEFDKNTLDPEYDVTIPKPIPFSYYRDYWYQLLIICKNREHHYSERVVYSSPSRESLFQSSLCYVDLSDNLIELNDRELITTFRSKRERMTINWSCNCIIGGASASAVKKSAGSYGWRQPSIFAHNAEQNVFTAEFKTESIICPSRYTDKNNAVIVLIKEKGKEHTNVTFEFITQFGQRCIKCYHLDKAERKMKFSSWNAHIIITKRNNGELRCIFPFSVPTAELERKDNRKSSIFEQSFPHFSLSAFHWSDAVNCFKAAMQILREIVGKQAIPRFFFYWPAADIRTPIPGYTKLVTYKCLAPLPAGKGKEPARETTTSSEIRAWIDEKVTQLCRVQKAYGDGWCLFYAAKIAPNRDTEAAKTFIRLLITEIGRNHEVERLIARSLIINFYSRNWIQMTEDFAKILKELHRINKLSPPLNGELCSMEFKHKTLDPHILRAYLLFIVKVAYPDPFILQAYLFVEGKGRKLAVFRRDENGAKYVPEASTISRFEDTVKHPQTIYVLHTPGTSETPPHYDGLEFLSPLLQEDDGAGVLQRSRVSSLKQGMYYRDADVAGPSDLSVMQKATDGSQSYEAKALFLP